MLASRLQKFSKRDAFVYNFRCPYCDDSKKNKNKSRGYIYKKGTNLFYRCHNCGIGRTLSNLIKDIDPFLHKEYRLEILKEKIGETKEYKHNSVDEKLSVNEPKYCHLDGLIKVSDLPNNHVIKQYVNKRLIPEDKLDRLYFVIRFMEWINTQIPGKFDEKQLKMDEPRLVIPFIDENGKVFAVTGRSFKKEGIRYLTIKFDEDADKIYGLDHIDKSKKVYAFEGPIDSFFVDNSIAFGGSSGKIPDFDNLVVVLDNEPRNKEIIRLIEKLIDDGREVCIWPEYIKEKDVNDLICAGMSRDQVKTIIDENTCSGLTAKIKLSTYKKT